MKTVTAAAAEAVCVSRSAAHGQTPHLINYVGAAANCAGILADTVLIPSSLTALTVLTARATAAEARSRDRKEPVLAARGESPASHRDWRCARLTRHDEGKYRQYVTEEQRRQPGCSAGRMQRDFHHGLLAGS